MALAHQALHIAIRNDDAAGVRDALARGADVNLLHALRDDKEAQAPLIRAVRTEASPAIVETLVMAGADLAAFTNDGYGSTALSIAASSGQLQVCRLLLASGCRVDERFQDGFTVLHVAANNGHAELCTFLAEAGADVNALNDAGQTALHEAAKNGEVDACRALVLAGASPSIRPAGADEYYLTPFQIAVRHGRVGVAVFFVDECHENPWQETGSGVPMGELPFDAGIRPAMAAALYSVRAERAIAAGFAAGAEGSSIATTPRVNVFSPI